MKKREILTVFDALEVNLAWYLEKVLKPLRVPLQILVTNDEEEMSEEGHVLEIDAHTDIDDSDGVLVDAALQLTLSSHTSMQAHKRVVAALYRSLFCQPIPKGRRLRATPEALRALNRVPGEPDKRPAGKIHVWDLNSPSESLGQDGQTVRGIIVCRAQVTAGDWRGAEPYGQ